MRLRLNPTTGDDTEAFEATKDTLLDQFEEWFAEGGETDVEATSSDAGVLVDWRYRHSTVVPTAPTASGRWPPAWCPKRSGRWPTRATSRWARR